MGLKGSRRPPRKRKIRVSISACASGIFSESSHTSHLEIGTPVSSYYYYLSLSLVGRWGTKDDRATTVLHSSLFSAFRRASPNFNPVHSVMLSSHLFFCLPLLLPPCTLPCRIIFASPVDLVLCPYHLSLRFFTVVRRSS